MTTDEQVLEAAQRILDDYNARMERTLGTWARVAPTVEALPQVARARYLDDARIALEADSDDAAAAAIYAARVFPGRPSTPWEKLSPRLDPRRSYTERAKAARGSA